MTLEFPRSIKFGAMLTGILGTAAGLNLSVMAIGAQPVGVQNQASALTEPADPDVRQVVVDVPVLLDGATTTSVATTAPTANAPAAAAPAPASSPPTSPSTTPISLPAPTPSLPPPTQPGTTPTTTSPAATEAPTTTATVPTSAVPTSSVSTTDYLYYELEGVAEIVVAYHNGDALEFWSATTEDGWAYMVEKNTANKVEVKFRRVSGGEGEAKFELIRSDGELEVKKEF